MFLLNDVLVFTKSGLFHKMWKYFSWMLTMVRLTHRGRVMHLCVGDLTNIGSANDLAPIRRQDIN